MTTISVTLDDRLDAAVERICKEQGRGKSELLTELVRHHVELDYLRKSLQSAELVQLYQELSADDVALAELGMDGYGEMLAEADQS